MTRKWAEDPRGVREYHARVLVVVAAACTSKPEVGPAPQTWKIRYVPMSLTDTQQFCLPEYDDMTI
jgi:hypothetical protein